ncbi:MAG: hypothetical protein ACLFVH_00915 [Phycisphaerae bacterium]
MARMHTLITSTMLLLLVTLVVAKEPWPSKIEGHTPPKPGEHPRLLFRKSDLPALRAKAKTPEGKAILKELGERLNGRDGRTMPGKMGHGDGPNMPNPANPTAKGTFTISHVVGYGLLYQITQDKRYAELGKKAMDAALAGWRGMDKRYSFRNPSGALRAGPSLGWYAVGYDLCYDGWDKDYRVKIAKEIANYNEGRNMSLAELVRGSRHHPRSNHWGMQVGGGAMALLAVLGDEGGIPADKADKLLETSEKSMIRNLSQGFGDGGYFAEGDGTGSMSSHIIFLQALEAWKNVAGKDFIAPRPNAQWTHLRWILGTVVKNGKPHFHSRDGYPHNVWDRDSISGGAYFGIGFGAATPAQKAGYLWFYNEFFKDHDTKKGHPYDTPGPYPHQSTLAFINWPVGLTPVNPAECMPRASVDHQYSYMMFRNRWKDENDIVMTCLASRPRGHTKQNVIGPLWITAKMKRYSWGKMSGKVKHFAVMRDGCATATTSDGTMLAVDFSGNSGHPAMLVMVGPGAPRGRQVKADDVTYSVHFIDNGDPACKNPPTPQAKDGKLVVGKQVVSVQDGKLVLHNTAKPWDGPSDKAKQALAKWMKEKK